MLLSSWTGVEFGFVLLQLRCSIGNSDYSDELVLISDIPGLSSVRNRIRITPSVVDCQHCHGCQQGVHIT